MSSHNLVVEVLDYSHWLTCPVGWFARRGGLAKSYCSRELKNNNAPQETHFHLAAGYGTVKGRMPSHGKRPVGLVAVDGCSRNIKRTKKPTEVDV